MDDLYSQTNQIIWLHLPQGAIVISLSTSVAHTELHIFIQLHRYQSLILVKSLGQAPSYMQHIYMFYRHTYQLKGLFAGTFSRSYLNRHSSG